MRRLAALATGLALVAASASAGALAAGSAGDVAELEQAIRASHPSPFHATSEADFAAAFTSLGARAPALDDDAFLVELMRTIALLGERDGHSGIHPLHTGHRRPMHFLPLKLYRFSDGYWVVAEAGPYGLVGTRVVAIDGILLETIEERARPLVPRDNEWTRLARLPEWVIVTEVLHGLGLVADTGARRLTVADANGAQRDVTLTPLARPDYDAALRPQFGGFVFGLPRRAAPISLAKRDVARYLGTLDGGRTVYLAYNQVTGSTVSLASRLVKLARRRVTRRVVVDVRFNGGGDNTTYESLVRALGSKQIPRRIAVYCLIGRDLFSAAGNFVAEVDRRTRAVFAGEPSGGAPNQWGDAVVTRLPDSGWEVFVAPQFVVSVAGDNRTAVEPQIPVPWTAADFLAGRDPVLAAVRAR